MNRYKLTIAVLSLLLAPPIAAMPILNASGTTLTNLTTSFGVYDVNFSDGILSNIFDLSDFNPGTTLVRSNAAEADAVSAALFDHFSANPIDYTAINGCETNNSGICFLFNPDAIDPTINSFVFYDYGAVWIEGNVPMMHPPLGRHGTPILSDTGNFLQLTAVTFTRATAIPIPSTGLLFALGLTGLIARKLAHLSQR